MPIIKRRKTKRIVYFLYLKHIIRYQDKLVINSQVTEHVFIFESYDVGVKRSFAPMNTTDLIEAGGITRRFGQRLLYFILSRILICVLNIE